MSLLRLEGVWKRHRTRHVETAALHDVSLDVVQGDYLAIRGASGAGKSTLISLLGLLDRVDAGRLFWTGEDITRASSSRLASLRRANIGFVFQGFHLVQDRSIVDNVMIGLEGLADSKARRRLALEALEAVGLSSRADHRPSQLSGGQQQRAAIARALARKPRLLICDEPTGNLDDANSRRVLDLVDSMHAAGSSVVIVTHDASVSARARRLIELQDGQILPAPGTPT